MQHIVTYVTGIYSYLSDVGFETQILNSEKLSSEHSIFTSARM